jgi:branched-chain amino acid transport system ATP-binding protein
MSAAPLLQVSGLSKKFGSFAVTDKVDFALKPGARHALIGPNGAGKTTFVNLLSGSLRPDEGRVVLDGADVTHLPEARRVKRGLGRTFQVNQLYVGLTTLENVLMAVAERRGIASSWIRSVWRYQDAIEEAYGLLAMVGIADEAKRRVGELSYGRQRLVEIAIALASQPKVLLLDEPAAGVPQGESGVILDVLDTLPKDIAVLMIEHDMDIVFRFAEAITVLVAGSVFAEGTPEQIRQHPGVREIYLGEHHG